MLHDPEITIEIQETPNPLVGVKAGRLTFTLTGTPQIKFKEFLYHGSILLELPGMYSDRHHFFVEI